MDCYHLYTDPAASSSRPPRAKQARINSGELVCGYFLPAADRWPQLDHDDRTWTDLVRFQHNAVGAHDLLLDDATILGVTNRPNRRIFNGNADLWENERERRFGSV